ncbi:unnamed protein product [Mycena citricolor]|uniref:Uncharacterized protein n=1 Tax=Mycena citricolor TaxID=2018698 RepID=A0AAD2HY21_9AGAR|nr:unnamed protein product [Mycena citricolor]
MSSSVGSPAEGASSTKRTPSDVFRPRLPLDPFSPSSSVPRMSQMKDPDTPWAAYELPLLAESFEQGPRVLLVLGASNPHVLSPILRSRTFSSSVVLYVTHTNPQLNAITAAIGSNPSPPCVRVLRLSAALTPTAPAFALTLVGILEAAAAVARSWRANPHSGSQIEQLSQDSTGSFTVCETISPHPSPPLQASEHLHHALKKRSSVPASPDSPYSTTRSRPPSALSVDSTASKQRSSFLNFSSRSSTSVHRQNPKRMSSPYPPTSKRMSSGTKRASGIKLDGTRAFDALISFLPPAQLEKAVLKQVVLVSTLAGTFLTGPTLSGSPRFASAPGSRRGSLSGIVPEWPKSLASGATSRTGSINGDGSDRPHSPARSIFSSIRSQPTSVYHAALWGTQCRPHIVHILPASYKSPKLSAALGAFVASYSAPAVPLPVSFSASSSSEFSEELLSAGGSFGQGKGKAHAYVVAERAVPLALETILIGGIDFSAEGHVRGGGWVSAVRVEETAASYGLPTPPDSRSGSGESGEEGQCSDEPEPAQPELPSMGDPVPQKSDIPSSFNNTTTRKLRRASQRRSDAEPGRSISQQPTSAIARTPSNRRRVESAPSDAGLAGIGARGGRPDESKIASSTARPIGKNRKTWSRGSRFFGGKGPDDFKLKRSTMGTTAPNKSRVAALRTSDERGRSSPDLRELPGGGLDASHKRRKPWWMFWA